MKQLSTFKSTFDSIWEQTLTQLINDLPRVPNPVITDWYNHLLVYARGGKRIRPFLVAVASNRDLADHDLKNAAIAIELIHTFALIHDDIMDESHVRRGVATVNAHITDETSSKKHGDSHALLIGDMVLACAYEFITSLPTETQQHFFMTLKEVVMGQTLDTLLTAKGTATIDELTTKNHLKTASYTFTRPLLIGASLAGVSETQMNELTTIGDLLGDAFQIRDDIIDYFPAVSKKTPAGDVQEGQPTFISQFMFNQASPEHQSAFRTFWQQPLDEQSHVELITLITDAGALDFARTQLTSVTDQAITTINASSLDNTQQDTLKTLATYLADPQV